MEPTTTTITRRVHHARKTLHPDDRFTDWVITYLLGMSGSDVAYHEEPGLFENMTGDEHWKETRTACIGVSGGEGDEHPVNGASVKTGESASSLWLKKLGVDDPALWQLREYCRRNDAGGYHENQFDLASIINALNYYHPDITEDQVQWIANQIFLALYMRDKKRLEALESEFWANARIFQISAGIFMAAVVSDNPAIEWASRRIGVALTVKQWSSGHIRITPGRIIPRWMMDEVVCLVRFCQMRAKGLTPPANLEILKGEGAVSGAEELFYYNGVLQNGMPTRPKTLPFKADFGKTAEAVAKLLKQLMQGE